MDGNLDAVKSNCEDANMIVIFYGTTGELIKLAPLLRSLKEESYITLCTGQQIEQIPTMLRQFGLSDPDVWLGRGHRMHDLSRMWELLPWSFHVIRRLFISGRRVINNRTEVGKKTLVVVHGDTVTTVLGAAFGRWLQYPVAHIEAGLRSYNWRHPFPEELDRLATSRLAQYHFAPGDAPASNLQRRGEIINTLANTIRDSLDMVPKDAYLDVRLPDIPFGIASLHRNELLRNRAGLTAIISLLREHASKRPILFIDHPVTKEAIERFSLGDRFDNSLTRIPKLGYFPFISLLKRSEFLVTDSGGVQEECFHLGHPCLIHRFATERNEGLGNNAELSGMDLGRVAEFLSNPGRFRKHPPALERSPTSIVLDFLIRRGFVQESDLRRPIEQTL